MKMYLGGQWVSRDSVQEVLNPLQLGPVKAQEPVVAQAPAEAPVAEAPVVAPAEAPVAEASASGVNTITIKWQKIYGATSYRIYRGSSSGGSFQTVLKSGVTGTSFTDSGLAPTTEYHYRVSAMWHSFESKKSKTASAFTSQSILETIRQAWNDGIDDSSPNSGISEAIFAYCAEVRMGGINYYKGNKKIKPIIAKSFPIASIISVKRILNLILRLQFTWLVSILLLMKFIDLLISTSIHWE